MQFGTVWKLLHFVVVGRNRFSLILCRLFLILSLTRQQRRDIFRFTRYVNCINP